MTKAMQASKEYNKLDLQGKKALYLADLKSTAVQWCLDMTFYEDYCRIRKDHLHENMIVVCHLALDILKLLPMNIR